MPKFDLVVRFAMLLTLAAASGAPVKVQHTRVNDAVACADHHESCENWAKSGECESNPGFMKSQCQKACDACGWVDPVCSGTLTRPAKINGMINSVFERAAARPELRPTVHSRPCDAARTPADGGRPCGGPWVMTFANFVRDDEADAFLETTASHFERSLAGDVVSPVRTSKQAWCQPGIASECYKHPLVRRLHERVANVTSVPLENAEFYQVLRYEPGQFYKQHHDQNAAPDSLMGVRLYTFFLYLVSPEGGGGTRFPKLNITVEPTRGTALLWPNVKDDDVRQADMRTDHEALPPTAGRKFSANLWLHNYDFRSPNMAGCKMDRHVDPAKRLPPLADGEASFPWPGEGPVEEEHVENDEL